MYHRNNIAILGALEEASSVLICIHNNPDADAIGSAFALKKTMETCWPDLEVCDVYVHQPIERYFKVFIGEENVGKVILPTRDKYDVVVVLDTSAENRTAKDFRDYADGTVIVIDHHVGTEDFGDMTISREVAATAYLIWELVGEIFGCEPTPEVATLLYVGLTGDTANFTNSNTDSEVFEMAMCLMDSGISPFEISSAFNRKSYAHMMLLGEAMAHLTVHQPNFCMAYVSEQMLMRTGATQSDAAAMIGYIKNVEDCDWAILLIEDGHDIRVRLRGSHTPVRDFAKELGGGGHEMASGCRITGDLIEVYNIIEAAAKAWFQNH